MTVRQLIADARSLAAQLRPDRAEVRRGTAGVFDPVDGSFVHGAGTLVYAGPCRVRMPSLSERTTLFGDVEQTATRFVVTFPHDIDPLVVDDTIAITAADDVMLEGRTMRVVAIDARSYLSRRQVGAEVIE